MGQYTLTRGVFCPKIRVQVQRSKIVIVFLYECVRRQRTVPREIGAYSPVGPVPFSPRRGWNWGCLLSALASDAETRVSRAMDRGQWTRELRALDPDRRCIARTMRNRSEAVRYGAVSHDTHSNAYCLPIRPDTDEDYEALPPLKRLTFCRLVGPGHDPIGHQPPPVPFVRSSFGPSCEPLSQLFHHGIPLVQIFTTQIPPYPLKILGVELPCP